jgi:hypothetical protein
VCIGAEMGSALSAVSMLGGRGSINPDRYQGAALKIDGYLRTRLILRCKVSICRRENGSAFFLKQ